MNPGLSGRRLFEAAWCAVELARDARTLPPDAGARCRLQAHTIQRACSGLLVSLGVEVRPIGPLPAGRVLLVSNHVSYLDSLILGAVVPTIPVAKREVSRWPVLGARGRELGVIYVNREDIHDRVRALRRARRTFLHGASILNFPEGTTTRGDMVFPFRAGLFGIARDLGVPIVPARIDYADESLAWVDDESFLPHFLRLTQRPSVQAQLRFGAPILAAKHESARAIADRTRKIIQRLHLE